MDGGAFPFSLSPANVCHYGFAWFLSAFGVYVRDIGQITGVFTTVLLFISGVFYPINALPAPYQGWLQLNPLVFIIEEGRNALIFGQLPDMRQWAIMLVAGMLIAGAGFTCFQEDAQGVC